MELFCSKIFPGSPLPISEGLALSRLERFTFLYYPRTWLQLQPHQTLCLSFPPSGNGKLASWASILGFVVMMSLDVGLG